MHEEECRVVERKKLITKAIENIEISTLKTQLLNQFELECKLDDYLSSPKQVVISFLERFEKKLKGYQQIEEDLPDSLIPNPDPYGILPKLETLRLKLATLYAEGIENELIKEKSSYDGIRDFIFKILSMNFNLQLKYFNLTIQLLEKIIADQPFNKEFVDTFDLLKLFVNEPNAHPNEQDLQYISNLAIHNIDNKKDTSTIKKMFYEVISELNKKLLFQYLLGQFLKIIKNQNHTPFIQFNIIFITKFLNDSKMQAADFNQMIGLVYHALKHYHKPVLMQKKFSGLRKIFNQKNLSDYLIEFEKDFIEKTSEQIVNEPIKLDLANDEPNAMANSTQESDISIYFPAFIKNEKIQTKFDELLRNFRKKKSETSVQEANALETPLNLNPEYKCSVDDNAILATQCVKISSENRKIGLSKKIKTRILDFDEEGVGYDVNSSYLYSKEVKRLSAMKIEKELSPKMRVKEELLRLGNIDVNEENWLKELGKQFAQKEFEFFASKEEKQFKQRDEEARQQTRKHTIEENIKKSHKTREILKDKQKKAAKQKKMSKLLDPVVFFIQNRIELFKEKLVNFRSLDLELFSSEAIKDDLLTHFLYSVDYNNFKKLIKCAEEILISIGEVKETLNKIDGFANSLGCSLDYSCLLDDSEKKIEEIFNEKSISNFLESSLNLFKQRTLNLDNHYCLLKIKNQNEKIEFSEPDFLSSFILDNSPKQILQLNTENLKQFFNQKDDTILYNKRYLENKDNILKLLFNFFSGKHYFSSQNHKIKFVKKFFLNSQEHPEFKSIKTEVCKLKWWQFILIGISPFRVFKQGFRELLSEKLFLNLIKEEFKNNKEEPCIKNIDALYSIQKRIKSSNIWDKTESISLPRIDAPRSRQEIINELKDRGEIKELLEKISYLASNATGCVNEFSRLLNVLQQENEKITPSLDLPSKIFFKNAAVRKSCFSINNTSNSSPSSVSRGIN